MKTGNNFLMTEGSCTHQTSLTPQDRIIFFPLAHDCVTLTYTRLHFNTNYHPLMRSTSHAFMRSSFVYVSSYLLGHSPEKTRSILGNSLSVQALRSQVAVHRSVPRGVHAAALMTLLPAVGFARRLHVYRFTLWKIAAPLLAPHGKVNPLSSSRAG